jgi:hypothetical protein
MLGRRNDNVENKRARDGKRRDTKHSAYNVPTTSRIVDTEGKRKGKGKSFSH